MAVRLCTSFAPTGRRHFSPGWDTAETRLSNGHPNLIAKISYNDRFHEALSMGFSRADAHDLAYAEALRAVRSHRQET